MKQYVSLTGLSPDVTTFILLWKKRKGYGEDLTLTLGQCIELLVATTYNLHYEESDGKFYNKLLLNDETVIGWDGEELIDILFYEVIQAVRMRLNKGGTFNESIVEV